MEKGQATGSLPSSQQADPKQKKRVMRALVLWTILFYASIVSVIVLSGLGFVYSAKWMLWHTVNIMNGLLILVVPCFVLLAGLVLGNKWIVQNVLAHRTDIFKKAFTRVGFQRYFDVGAYTYKRNLAQLIRCSGVCCRDWGKMRVNDQVTGVRKGLRFLLLDLCLKGGFKTLFQGQMFVVELPKYINWRSFDIQTEIVNQTHDFDSTAAMQNTLFKEEFVFSYPEQNAGILNVLSQYGFENNEKSEKTRLLPGNTYTPDELLSDDFARFLVSLREQYSGIFLHVQRNYLFIAFGSVENDGEDLFEPMRFDIFRQYEKIEQRVFDQVKTCVDVLDGLIDATHMVPDRVETVLEMRPAAL